MNKKKIQREYKEKNTEYPFKNVYPTKIVSLTNAVEQNGSNMDDGYL